MWKMGIIVLIQATVCSLLLSQVTTHVSESRQSANSEHRPSSFEPINAHDRNLQHASTPALVSQAFPHLSDQQLPQNDELAGQAKDFDCLFSDVELWDPWGWDFYETQQS